MTVLLTDNLPLLAGAPNGIKKLRELILELAVRGKLIPQDPNDLPASELLEQIVEEKVRYASGRRKLSEPTLDVSEEIGEFKLPSTWRWVRFGDIAQHNSGKTLDKGKNTGIAREYITTSNLYWGRFELSNLRQMLIEESDLARCTAVKNDLLICEGGEAGRAAVWDQEREICFQNHVHRARFYGGIQPFYVQRYFEKLNYTGEISEYRKGVGISNMSSKALASITMPLPPLAEQHRIVAKVDELMALCDRLEAQQADAESAHARLVQALLDSLTQASDATDFAANWQRLAEHFHTLFTTESSIDTLKQTLLQLAVMGKLIPQDPNDEPASKLLVKIKNDLCEAHNLSSVQAKERNSSITNPADYHYEIPVNWVWCELQDIAIFYNGKPHEEFIVSDGGYILINSKFVSTNGSKFKFSRERLSPLYKNDIVFVMSDVPCGRALARCYLVEEDDKYTLNQRISAFRTARSINVDYLIKVLDRNKYYLDCDDGKKQTNLKKIQVISCPIPLPPLLEQHRIVAKVDQLMALCDQLKSRLTQARQINEQLASTLVEQAVA